MAYNPMIGTLSQGDVYPGLATPDNPSPDLETTDQKSSAAALEGATTANAMRPSVWFVAFAVLLVILYMVHGG